MDMKVFEFNDVLLSKIGTTEFQVELDKINEAIKNGSTITSLSQETNVNGEKVLKIHHNRIIKDYTTQPKIDLQEIT